MMPVLLMTNITQMACFQYHPPSCAGPGLKPTPSRACECMGSTFILQELPGGQADFGGGGACPRRLIMKHLFGV